MAISRTTTWSAGQVLTAAALNDEFNNILNNGIDLWSPAAKAVDFNGFEVVLDADGDTSVIASTDDRIDVKASGVSSLFRLDGTVASPVNGVHLIAAATGVNPRVEADGTDTNVGLRLAGQGTGAVVNDGPTAILAQMMGFSNVSFTATVAGSALTIALKDAAGNDPTVASPCKVWMRSATLTTAAPVHLSRTSALSITVPSGAELGTIANTNTRLYLGASTTDGSTWDTLVVFNTQSSNQHYALPSESAVHSAAAIGTGSDSAGALYGSSATTSMPVKWLGFIEISEATPGTWASAPTVLQVYGPGIPRSGDIVQTSRQSTTTQATNDTSTPADSNLTASLTPSSSCNRVLVTAHQNGVRKATNSGEVDITLLRGATQIADARAAGDSTNGEHNVSFIVLDNPATTSSTTYKTQLASVDNNAQARVQEGGNSTSTILLQEIFA